ncbi:MAG TPA: hypothetical protein VIT91_04165 [Chthoniobacterales bacterium]
MSGEEGRNIHGGEVTKSRSKHSCLLPLFPLVTAFIPAVSAQTSEPPRPLPTLEQSIFRSRWVGPQYDQPTPTPAPTLELEPAETRSAEESETPKPTPTPAPIPEAWDASLGDGFYLGAINIIPTLTVGWEYSNENNSGTDQTGSNTSFFIAPGLALLYGRELGAWSVSVSYAAAYVYSADGDFNANGGQGNNDTIQQTLSLSVSVQGSRYRITGSITGSTGTGFDTESSQNNDQITYNANLTSYYQIAEQLSLDTGLHYSQLSSSNANTAPDSDRYNIDAEAVLNHSWTGKTTFRYFAGAGRESQSVADDPNAYRQYVQTLVGLAYVASEKIDFSVGVGARYVEEPEGTTSRDDGLLPAYNAAVRYRPSEKTMLNLRSSLDGTDVEPDFNFDAYWRPRETTTVRLSLYQTQGYSGEFSSQILIQRGISASIDQELSIAVTCSLLGGYEQQDYDNGSNDESDLVQAQDDVFGSFQLNWQIRHWLSLETRFWLRNQINDDQRGNDDGVTNGASVALRAVF